MKKSLSTAIFIIVIFVFYISYNIFFTKDLEDYSSELQKEAQRINYCNTKEDCKCKAVNLCPGEFILYNKNEDTNNYMRLYYICLIGEEYKSQKDKPICDADVNLCKIMDPLKDINCVDSKCVSYKYENSQVN